MSMNGSLRNIVVFSLFLGVAASTNPPLTTVVQPVPAMAEAAGRRLLAMLRGDELDADPIVFAPVLVRRVSA